METAHGNRQFRMVIIQPGLQSQLGRGGVAQEQTGWMARHRRSGGVGSERWEGSQQRLGPINICSS